MYNHFWRKWDTNKGQGTLAFMAIDILSGTVEHTALHDAESMLYVLIWIAIIQAGPHGRKRSAEGFTIKGTILDTWSPDPRNITLQSLVVLSDSKRGVMITADAIEDRILDAMHSYFEPIAGCIFKMARTFARHSFGITRESTSDIMKRRKSRPKGKPVDGVGTEGPREDKRPKEIIFTTLRNILSQYIDEVMEYELGAKRTAEQQTVMPAENKQGGKSRDRVVIDGPIAPASPAQVAPTKVGVEQLLRRSNRIKALQAGQVVPITRSETSTGKRARAEKGSDRYSNKRLRGSGRVNK